MSPDPAHMRRALRLALRGRGRVSPNPMVGAVIARDGHIVGEGAHLRVGGAHAEVEALSRAGERARGGDLYVTLEPCSFHGRTPPCSRAVLRAGIRKVYCAMVDPDPRVSGRGIEALRQGGVEVEVGLLQEQAQSLNEAYIKHRSQGLPLVLLKLAQSLDGRIATAAGDARWISGEQARRHAHRWRSWIDAVVVGANTVLADDPQLSVRHVRGRDPRPIVVDGRLRSSPAARLFARPGAVLVTSESAPAEQRAPFAARGAQVWTFPDRDGRIALRAFLERAAAEGLTSLMVEGGGRLAAAFLRERLVDRVQLYLAPRLLGEGIAGIGDLGIIKVDQAIRLEQVRTRRLGADLLYTAAVRYSCSPD